MSSAHVSYPPCKCPDTGGDFGATEEDDSVSSCKVICQNYNSSDSRSREQRARSRPFIRKPPPCVFAPCLPRRHPSRGMLIVERGENAQGCLDRLVRNTIPATAAAVCKKSKPAARPWRRGAPKSCRTNLVVQLPADAEPPPPTTVEFTATSCTCCSVQPGGGAATSCCTQDCAQQTCTPEICILQSYAAAGSCGQACPQMCVAQPNFQQVAVVSPPPEQGPYPQQPVCMQMQAQATPPQQVMLANTASPAPQVCFPATRQEGSCQLPCCQQVCMPQTQTQRVCQSFEVAPPTPTVVPIASRSGQPVLPSAPSSAPAVLMQSGAHAMPPSPPQSARPVQVTQGTAVHEESGRQHSRATGEGAASRRESVSAPATPRATCGTDCACMRTGTKPEQQSHLSPAPSQCAPAEIHRHQNQASAAPVYACMQAQGPQLPQQLPPQVQQQQLPQQHQQQLSPQPQQQLSIPVPSQMPLQSSPGFPPQDTLQSQMRPQLQPQQQAQQPQWQPRVQPQLQVLPPQAQQCLAPPKCQPSGYQPAPQSPCQCSQQASSAPPMVSATTQPIASTQYPSTHCMQTGTHEPLSAEARPVAVHRRRCHVVHRHPPPALAPRKWEVMGPFLHAGDAASRPCMRSRSPVRRRRTNE